MFGALFERKSATINAAKSREPEYLTTAPVAFSKQLTVFVSISSSLPSIEPAMVTTSPSKRPRSLNFDGVSHTSALATPASVKDATAAAPSVLKLIVIKISPNFLCFFVFTGRYVDRRISALIPMSIANIYPFSGSSRVRNLCGISKLSPANR